VLINLVHAGLLSMLAALAVDLGFSAAFIDDVVAYMVTLYSTALVALLVGRRSEHWSHRVPWRLPFVVAVSVVVVASLRSWALFALPLGDGWQSGYSPYFVLTSSGLSFIALVELLARLTPRADTATRGRGQAPPVRPRAPAE
jgi:hypothetical protein